MASNQKQVYKGRRRRLNIMGFVAAVVAFCIVAAFLAFYSFQKYLVFKPDELSLELPILGAASESTDESGFEIVTAELTVKDPDYSGVAAAAGDGVSAINALFVPSGYVNTEGVAKFKSVMSMYGATGLVLEVKPAGGQLVWASSATLAASYLTNGSVDLTTIVSGLKDEGIYVAVQLSCCLDSMLAERGSSMALKSAGGGIMSNEDGMWLDPYNSSVRSYIIELCEELADMGVDEIILDNISQPVSELAVSYTVSLSFTPSATTAVCGFARTVTRALSGYDVTVSAVLEGATLHDGAAAQTGQDITLFSKVFDRLCCEENSAWQYGVDLDTVAAVMEIGDAHTRFPSLVNFIPDGASSWIVLVPDALVSTTE